MECPPCSLLPRIPIESAIDPHQGMQHPCHDSAQTSNGGERRVDAAADLPFVGLGARSLPAIPQGNAISRAENTAPKHPPEPNSDLGRDQVLTQVADAVKAL